MLDENKKQELTEYIYKVAMDCPILLTMSSPHVNRKRGRVNKSFAAPIIEAENPFYTSSKAAKSASEKKKETKADAALDIKDLSVTQLKKIKRQQQKEKKLYDKMRRDALSRGFETDILKILDAPEDIYDMSDYELYERDAKRLINQDGYYDFVMPKDHRKVKIRRLDKRTLLLIALCTLSLVAVLIYTVNNAVYLLG